MWKLSVKPFLYCWAFIGLAAIAGCANQPQTDSPDIVPAAKTRVYECGEFEFVTSTLNDEVTVYLPEDTLILAQSRSASGVKYEGAGSVLWLKGDEAMLDLGYRTYRGCQLNVHRGPWEDARRRGVQFRAVGQEPGWYLEIKPGHQMLLVTNYGSNRYLFDAPDPVLDSETAIYQVNTDRHALSVEINTDWCQDGMSGQVYSNRVLLDFDGQVLRGCGEAFEDEWR